MELLKLVLGTVPQWYPADCGPHSVTLTHGPDTVTYYSARALTPLLNGLHTYMEGQLATWSGQFQQALTPAARAKITEDVALQWLAVRYPNIQWPRIFAYIEELKHSTYENDAVGCNLVISTAAAGTTDLASHGLAKILAPIAASSDTYLRVSADLRYIEYDEVAWSDVVAPTEYKFHPDFLHPFVCALQPGECSVHLTRRGDTVVLDKQGFLATNRRGRWRVYDVNTFKNFFVDALGDYRLGCNVFDLVFDLSYRRHGALFVYDPTASVQAQVSNAGATLGANADAPRAMLRQAVGSIQLGAHAFSARKKRLLQEIASLDGAVIYRKDGITAFGAFIRTHDDVASHVGARTTAANSAYLWGGVPIKVSADGDVLVFFKSSGGGHDCDAFTEFM